TGPGATGPCGASSALRRRPRSRAAPSRTAGRPRAGPPLRPTPVAGAGSGGAGEVPFVAHLRHAAEHEATKAHRLLALGVPAKDAWHAQGPNSAAGRGGGAV